MTIIQKVEKKSLTIHSIGHESERRKMKGVNKLVLEVRPEDEYFEKAILFLRPEKVNTSQKELSCSAEKLLSGIKNKENNKKSRTALLIFAGLAAGSSISWAIVFLFGILGQTPVF